MSNQQEMVQMNRRKQTFYSKADEAKFKIILVGDSGVGKTSLFLEFTDEEKKEEKRNTTVTAVDFRLQPLQIDGQMIKLHIWDTAGQERYRSMVQSFFKGCQGAIIVFDLSNKQSFIHATTEWYKMCANRVSPSQIVLIANKSDLQHLVTEKQIHQWSTKNNVSYFLTSVENKLNIEEPFIQLSKKMIKKKREQVKGQICSQIKQNPNEQDDVKVKLQSNFKSEKKKKCC